MEITLAQWLLGTAAAMLVGMSKTGIPGVGILVVTLLAAAFGGWASIGVMLPMLVFADIFAVLWYRQHAQWPILVRLFPWVLAGVALGAGILFFFGQSERTKALMDPLIAGIVLLMLALHLLHRVLGPRLAPKSAVSTATAGAAAGVATTISNAAGPIMSMYMAGQGIPKEQFIGTIAWYFFIINLTKVPIYAAQGSLFTAQSLTFNAVMIPGILAGAFFGKWLLPRISQKAFDGAVVVLAALSAVQLLVPWERVAGWLK